MEDDKLDVVPLLHPAASIRLFTIGPGDEDSLISISLGAYDLETSPSYIGISYTWGSPELTRTIEINGIITLVRENCWEALWQCRLQHSDRHFWMDALCIDQASASEKNVQVQMMDQIYSKAEAVWACIGMHDDDTRFLFDRLEDKRIDAYDPQVSSNSDNYGVNPKAVEIWQATFARNEWLSAVNGIRAVTRRPYFSRLWIVQEVALASELFIFCGASKTPDTTFGRIFDCLSEGHRSLNRSWADEHTMADPPRNDLIDADLVDEVDRVLDLMLYRYSYGRQVTAKKRAPGSCGLSHLLDHFGRRHCSEKKDKVYAMRGQLESKEDMQKVKVDYDTTDWDVALNAMDLREPDGIDTLPDWLVDLLELDSDTSGAVDVLRKREERLMRDAASITVSGTAKVREHCIPGFFYRISRSPERESSFIIKAKDQAPRGVPVEWAALHSETIARVYDDEGHHRGFLPTNTMEGDFVIELSSWRPKYLVVRRQGDSFTIVSTALMFQSLFRTTIDVCPCGRTGFRKHSDPKFVAYFEKDDLLALAAAEKRLLGRGQAEAYLQLKVASTLNTYATFSCSLGNPTG